MDIKKKLINEDTDEENSMFDTNDNIGDSFGIDIDEFIDSVATRDGKEFYIMDYDYFKETTNLGYSDFETICDSKYGYGNWGDNESFRICDNCFEPVYTEDYYSKDWWAAMDGSFFCGDCTRKVSEITEAYLEHIINNTIEGNMILNEDNFEEAGFVTVKTYNRYTNEIYEFRNSFEKEIVLNELLEENPNGQFVFDDTSNRHCAIIWGRNLREDYENE